MKEEIFTKLSVEESHSNTVTAERMEGREII
jgi:hypothetical protein